jgi:hypothetical protein
MRNLFKRLARSLRATTTLCDLAPATLPSGGNNDATK